MYIFIWKKLLGISSKGLPLGLRHSPTLANLYLNEFDSFVVSELKSIYRGVKYTRYADDIIISLVKKKQLKFKDSYFLWKVKTIVEENLEKNNLQLNHEKTILVNFDNSNHVKFLGLNINRRKNGNTINVGTSFRKGLYEELVHIEKFSKNAKHVNFCKLCTRTNKTEGKNMLGKIIFLINNDDENLNDKKRIIKDFLFFAKKMQNNSDEQIKSIVDLLEKYLEAA
ncbi:reverse transcriptase domain-containing protein [[Acholeplasma] multilocale]|uniref:reverse transcriptase domain-containing protein n=1 Tax=[Acholeplasma] multilocale TaxID=264638 RepID=UPI00047D8844|nr:reverse transcriptase domain-containing protein [[Acholeplasma] multilocale]